MKIFNFIKGRQGESIAENYLKKTGYKIIQKNYKTKIAEIDIIAQKDNILTFIEVKLRKDSSFGMAYEAVDRIKTDKIRKNAELFINTNDLEYDGISFDIIEIYTDSNEINHIKSAF